MKVLQINTVCGKGSTGTIAVDIAKVLRFHGHDAYIAYGQGTATYDLCYRIGSKFENHFHNLFFSRILGLQGYGTIFGTWRLLHWIDKIKPDVVHLHNLHGNYINHPMLYRYLIKNQIPVVFTLHDCYNFTGKCSHFTVAKCRKWMNGCNNCPIYKKTTAPSYFFDHSRFLYNQKKQWYKQLGDIQVISVSQWLNSIVKKSILSTNKSSINYIYNWIDCEKFKPIYDPSVYQTYGIDPNKKYIIGVSAVWDTQQSRYQDAMRLAAILPEEYQLVLVGKLVGQAEQRANTIFIPYVNGVKELSKLYSSAIAFAGFSVEDTFGKVIAEAMLCGTPAIVFNSTACPEVVGEAGFIVPPHDIEAMLQAVKRIDQEGKERFSQQAIEYVKANYDYKPNVKKYLDLYLKIVNK